jgi:3-hydroxyacyl-CoA dehydrogenase
VADADWIIEAAPEDLALKQRLLEQLEQVARRAAIVTSSTSGLHASDLVARLRRPERFLVAHPLNPVELIPVIELVPGPRTDPLCVEDVRAWLQRLDRAPVVLHREVPGNAVGRIAAAVWRECIDLVLEDVIDVEDVDRLVALGPSLGWAAAGPHLTYHLGAGEHGVGVFLANLLKTFEDWWAHLATWDRLEPEQQARLVRAIERAYGDRVAELRAARDERLGRLLAAVRPSESRDAAPPVAYDPTRPIE